MQLQSIKLKQATTKPLPHRAVARPPAPAVPPPRGQLWLKPEQPQSEEPLTPNEIVRANISTILMRFAAGDSMDDIGKDITPTPLTGMQIRHTMMADRELRARLDAVVEHRAHGAFEFAMSMANKSKTAGDYGKAADIAFKAAERLLPKVYGPKAELAVVGKLELEGTVAVKMTPDEAYLKMVRGDGL